MNSNSKLYDINRNGEWRHSNDHCDGITFHFSIKQPKIQSFHELAINGWSLGTEFHSLLKICSTTAINPLFEKHHSPFTFFESTHNTMSLAKIREFDLFIFFVSLFLKRPYELNINYYEPDQQSHASIEIKKNNFFFFLLE